MVFRILSLLGGGAKGVFSLGVLAEAEALLGVPLNKHFDLIAGTSTGAIIGALLSLGKSVPEIIDLYRRHIPKILGRRRAGWRTELLVGMAKEVFQSKKFDAFQTRTAIVTTNLTHSRPTIFKSYSGAWAGSASFKPGFDRTIAEAISAFCAAYPYFKPVSLDLNGSKQELIDGGFSANDPSFFAIVDAIGPLQCLISDVRLLTVGTGRFATRERGFFGLSRLHRAVEVFEATLETTGTTQEFLIKAVYPQLTWCRIPSSSTDAGIQTHFLETHKGRLDEMFECGRVAFRESEVALKSVIL